MAERDRVEDVKNLGEPLGRVAVEWVLSGSSSNDTGGIEIL